MKGPVCFLLSALITGIAAALLLAWMSGCTLKADIPPVSIDLDANCPAAPQPVDAGADAYLPGQCPTGVYGTMGLCPGMPPFACCFTMPCVNDAGVSGIVRSCPPPDQGSLCCSP